ncbi:hypothetical protein REPUB_Repub03eG0268700 [Reevesia pubescens]
MCSSNVLVLPVIMACHCKVWLVKDAFEQFMLGVIRKAIFLRQFLLYFCLHQMSIAIFHVIGSLDRNMIVANTFEFFAMLVVMALRGYIISRDRIPSWWIWGYWVSRLMYAQNIASVNEFLENSWDKRARNYTNLSLGEALLRARNYFPESYWYWIGVGALLGYIVLLNILFTFFLANLNPLRKQQAIFSKEELQERDMIRNGENVVTELRHYLQNSSSLSGWCIILTYLGMHSQAFVEEVMELVELTPLSRNK